MLLTLPEVMIELELKWKEGGLDIRLPFALAMRTKGCKPFISLAEASGNSRCAGHKIRANGFVAGRNAQELHKGAKARHETFLKLRIEGVARLNQRNCRSF